MRRKYLCVELKHNLFEELTVLRVNGWSKELGCQNYV